MFSSSLLQLLLPLLVMLAAKEGAFAQIPGEILDNRDSCAHRVVNCDPNVDHFETKISMDYASSVTRLDYENTHILLEQSWPTRGPWMKNTTQKVVFVRCGCPLPNLSADWSTANVIHIPVSTIMVQMPNTLSKVYMLGQRSKVAAIESNRWISDATPELQTDIRDGIVRRLDLSPNGIPSTRITLSFENGNFDGDIGFSLQLVQDDTTLGETECFYPTAEQQQPTLEVLMDTAFNSIQGWVDAGNVWILTSGDPLSQPTTSLSFTMYFDNQLPQNLDLKGVACGESINNNNLEFKMERDSAPNNRPIYYRLHDLPNGFPDVLITEPRSLGPLANNDPKILARQFIDSDPGEATPLGRAELMKLMSLMLGSESTGNALFETIKTRYNDVKAIASKAKYRPTVMVGKPGTWNEAARNSWMITVGSTYVGEFLRDANVEYRNSDDSVNQAICGSGCGACPSGTSDTRCSVEINEYLDLFRHADYWITAGIGANCWSGSCNFAISSEDLLAQNPQVFSQFLAMKCGTLIGLDKSQLDNGGGGGNTYWELGRLRPDLVLQDLVTLMHPDLEIEDETTFFRMLDPLYGTTIAAACPRTLLPETPQVGTVHATTTFRLDYSSSSSSSEDLIGQPKFAIMDKFYPLGKQMMADACGVFVEDLEVAMSNQEVFDESGFSIVVTVRVPFCKDVFCGVETAKKLDSMAHFIEMALGLSWVSVQRDATSTVVVDSKGDIVPLEILDDSNAAVVASDEEEEPVAEEESEDHPTHTTTTSGGSSHDMVEDDMEESKINNTGLGSGAIVGIVIGVLTALGIVVVGTYKYAYAKGQEDSKVMEAAAQEGPEMVS